MNKEIEKALVEYNNLCHSNGVPIAFNKVVGKLLEQERQRIIEEIEKKRKPRTFMDEECEFCGREFCGEEMEVFCEGRKNYNQALQDIIKKL